MINFSPGLNHNPFGGFLCGWFVGYNLYLHQACRIFIFFLYGWRWETCRYCRLIAPFWAFVLKMIEDVCHHPDLQLQRWWCLCHIFYQPVWFNCVTEQFSPSPTPNALHQFTLSVENDPLFRWKWQDHLEFSTEPQELATWRKHQNPLCW